MDKTDLMRALRARSIEVDIRDTRPIHEIALALGIVTSEEVVDITNGKPTDMAESGIIAEEDE